MDVVSSFDDVFESVFVEGTMRDTSADRGTQVALPQGKNYVGAALAVKLFGTNVIHQLPGQLTRLVRHDSRQRSFYCRLRSWSEDPQYFLFKLLVGIFVWEFVLAFP